MINFLDIRLPDEISLGAVGGPEFSTDIITSVNGHECRNINWMQARAKYNIAPAINTEEQIHEIISFFRLCRGRAIGFRFKDFSDYIISKQVLGIGDGKTKVFPIIKKYQNSNFEFIRQISKPVINTIEIYLNSQKTNCSYSCVNGIIIFDKPIDLGVEVAVSCEFDVPVRFDTDNLSASVDALLGNAWSEIPLIEIRD